MVKLYLVRKVEPPKLSAKIELSNIVLFKPDQQQEISGMDVSPEKDRSLKLSSSNVSVTANNNLINTLSSHTESSPTK